MRLNRKTAHKFKNVPMKEDGHNFPSQLEWRYFKQLQLRQKVGEVLFFLRQVPFALPGGKKYVCDFQEFLSNGEIVFSEVKGFMTPLAQLKIDQVEDLYPVKINIVSKV